MGDRDEKGVCCLRLGTTHSKTSPHPLLLSPVLEVLFSNCDYETLKSIRQVCKLWLTVSSSVFIRTTSLNFFQMSPETFLGITKTAHQNGSQVLPANVTLTLSPSAEEIRNVCPGRICEEYIFPFGAPIHSLKFYAWDTVSEHLNGDLFEQILMRPERLESLDISLLPRVVSLRPLFPRPWKCRAPLFHLSTLVMYGKLDCTEEFLYNFLSAMPNINNITLNCCSVTFLDMFTSALHVIGLNKVQNLKLNFAQVINEQHVRNIEKANLALRTIHIAQRSVLRQFKEYESLLTQVAGTLEDAKLTCCTCNSVRQEQFITMPVMPHLKILRLQCWGILGIWNLGFVNYTPNLETLVMERRGLFAPILHPPERWKCFMEGKDVRPHIHLKNLTLPAIPLLFMQKASLRNVLHNFSGLRKLTLSANDACLRCMFQLAPQLEELTIAEYSKITDDGMTGLVTGEIHQDHPDGTGLSSPKDCNVSLGITALQNLRKLEIDGFWGKLTDFCIKHGLVHLSKLRHVMLRGCKVSDRSVQSLSEIQVTVVVVGYDVFHTYEPEPIDDPLLYP